MQSYLTAPHLRQPIHYLSSVVWSIKGGKGTAVLCQNTQQPTHTEIIHMGWGVRRVKITRYLRRIWKSDHNKRGRNWSATAPLMSARPKCDKMHLQYTCMNGWWRKHCGTMKELKCYTARKQAGQCEIIIIWSIYPAINEWIDDLTKKKSWYCSLLNRSLRLLSTGLFFRQKIGHFRQFSTFFR